MKQSDKKPALPHKEARSLVPVVRSKATKLMKALGEGTGAGKENIPNASLVYGVAAALLFAISLYYLFTASWLNGFLVFVLGVALFGYALHFIQNPD